MSVTQFFLGVQWKPSDYPNFFIIGKGSNALYSCAYNDRNNGSKESIMEISRHSPADFDFHHIVEQQHLADISYNGLLTTMYNFQIPTVLLHNREHQLRYNSILHVAQTRHLYLRTETKNLGIPEKEREATKLYSNTQGRKQLKERTLEMKKLYSVIYELDHSLKRIAMNIFDCYLKAF